MSDVDEKRAAYEAARAEWASDISAMVADNDGDVVLSAARMTAALDALIAAVREQCAEIADGVRRSHEPMADLSVREVMPRVITQRAAAAIETCDTIAARIRAGTPSTCGRHPPDVCCERCEPG